MIQHSYFELNSAEVTNSSCVYFQDKTAPYTVQSCIACEVSCVCIPHCSLINRKLSQNVWELDMSMLKYYVDFVFIYTRLTDLKFC